MIKDGGKGSSVDRVLAEAELAGLTPIVITDTRNLPDFGALHLVEDEVHGLFTDDTVREQLAELIRRSRSTATSGLEQR